jgi:hypothetical protein
MIYFIMSDLFLNPSPQEMDLRVATMNNNSLSQCFIPFLLWGKG